MKLLYLVVNSSHYRQPLDKISSRLLKLGESFEKIFCYVIGPGLPLEADASGIAGIRAEDPEEQYACCRNLAESLNPDLIYLSCSGANLPLLNYIKLFPNTVLERPEIYGGGLPGAESARERELRQRITSGAAGLVAMSEESLKREFEGLALPAHGFVQQDQSDVSLQKLASFLNAAAGRAKAGKMPEKSGGPWFSVIIPCYNQAAYLPAAVASLAAQNFEDMEVVIVNDGSSDNTSEVALELIEIYPYLKIRLVEQENMGVSVARNTAVKHSSGQWIIPLDGDDMLAENALQAISRIITEKPHVDMVTGMLKEFGARESDWKQILYFKKALWESNSIPCTAAFRRSLCEAVGGYDPSHPWGFEDWHFWVKCSVYGWKPFCSMEPLLLYRIHPETSRNQDTHDHLEDTFSLHHTMLPSVYGNARIIKAHDKLMSMDKTTMDRLQKALEARPDLPLLWFWLGLYHEGGGEFNEALPFYMKALKLDAGIQKWPGSDGLAWQIQYRLYHIYQAISFTKGVLAARLELELLKPELGKAIAAQERIIETVVEAKKPGLKRILLLGEHFWPCPGDQEFFLETLGSALTAAGYEVHVATKAQPGREVFEHNGVRIHEFLFYSNLERGFSGGLDDLDLLVQQGGFSQVICLARMDEWPMYLCMLPKPRPKVLFMPLLDNYDDFIRQNALPEILHVLNRAEQVASITERSAGRQLLELAGIPSIFLPLMVPKLEVASDFRRDLSIAADMPLFLNIPGAEERGDRLALIKSMKYLKGDWRMLVAVGPELADFVKSFRKAVDGDKHFILLEGVGHDTLASGIAAADVLLLGDDASECQVGVLQAMSMGTPWLAGAACVAAQDLAGGFVAGLARFPLILSEMMNSASIRETLAELGKRHWSACFSPQAVLPAFIKIIEDDAQNMPDLTMPAE
ncbi:glycosyltransferase, partial [Desulfovibrio sp. OttesenSCG-928-C14]|nr:glycosyltransferase [Desulfovibrio sp. OttesenSCG-928-C14]